MLQIFKGIIFRRRITVIDESGGRADLTGKTVNAQIRARGSSTPALDLSVGTGVTLLAQTGATLGQADLEVSANATNALQLVQHSIVVLVDGQVAMAPTKLPVRAL